MAVAVWVLERGGEAFYQGEATTGLGNRGEASSAVQTELERLADWGMLRRMDLPGDRRAWYVQLDSPLWDIFQAAGTALGLVEETALQGKGSVER